MKAPQNVNNILNTIKDLLGATSDAALAKALEIGTSTLSMWRKRNTFDHQILFTFCGANGFDLNEVIYGEKHAHLNAYPDAHLNENSSVIREPDVEYLPRLVTVDTAGNDAISIVSTKAAAGYLNGYADPVYIQDLPTISAPGFKGGLHRCFEVKGNSMPPNHDGSLAVGRYTEKLSDIRSRRVYIIASRNDGIVLKRVINQPDEGKLILISDNPNKREFPNYTIDHNEVVEIWEWRGALIRSIPDPSDFYNRMNDMEAKVTMIDEIIRQMQGKNEIVIKQNKHYT